ncbi:hypothetical protein KUCAC02_023265 [Chaenocephalus aceratus]|uniref:Uncharacterized protein n=1 Tax=Chaenocephalus aceratus TaxID=36190 RepID=A0ACB9XR96_CHAAC|nr:hypothetical protein KUCAC02_023265 [Chaenocephalus aceratus]
MSEQQAVVLVIAYSGHNLVRKKREWILPAKSLKENVDYTRKEFIAKIRSDLMETEGIQYSLEGIGANKSPFNVFVVDPHTGFIRVTRQLDREEVDTYNLSGIATYTNGEHAEKKIDVRIKVIDENDNAPVFAAMKAGEVKELSRRGTSVMKITATDADEPGNINSQIAYTIVDQQPPGDMFSISKDGIVSVKSSALDRETADQYTLTVKGQDLNGVPGGHSATSTVVINVQDVNDNLPTLEKVEYEGSIEENTKGVEVMRIRTGDLDLQGSENWEAVFVIVKGNEAGYFSIKTDTATNEGILMLDKAVDYEDVKNLDLGLIVKNKNQPEGPSFDPKVKAIPVSEESNSVNINEVITRYTAVDGDTGEVAENVRYAKGTDPGNWFTIDPITADIKLNKVPDRESPYLINGTYYAKVLCITEDMPAKTATGTIAIQVEDFNDHCPTLTSQIQTLCIPEDAVIVNAKDEDFSPNGSPFTFEMIPEGTQGKWQVEHFNDTAAILRAKETLWPGLYEVTFVVKDQQGQACPEPEKVTVQVCTCEEGVMCGDRGNTKKGAEFGPAGIGLLFLGLLLLLFCLLLLLFCGCGEAAGFTEMPFDTKSHLINYRTEGQGENTEVPLLNIPPQVDGGVVIGKAPMQQSRPGMYPGYSFQVERDGWGMSNVSEFGTWIKGDASQVHQGMYEGMALPDHFLGQYYSEKLTSENENFGGKDGLLVYDYEGQSSLAGSVGCCSLLESENDLQFIDDLGMKFKTLAEVCGGKKIETEVKPAFIYPPSASIQTPTSAFQQPAPPPKLHQTTSQTVISETSGSSQVVKESTATAMEGMTAVRTGMTPVSTGMTTVRTGMTPVSTGMTAVRTGMTTVSTGMTPVSTGMTTAMEGMVNQGPMILLQQQPVYYTTTTPVQMQYVLQPQVQNTVLLAEAPSTNLQGMVLLNGSQTGHAQGVVVQGQTVMSSGRAQGQRMVLVEKSRVHGSGGNLIHSGNLSGSKTMMVVEGKAPKGTLEGLKSSQTHFIHGGTLQSGGLSGSLVVEGQSNRGQLVKEAGCLSLKRDISGSRSNVVTSSTTTVNTSPTYRKVVVQETREIH